jgi:hypothetical protein
VATRLAGRVFFVIRASASLEPAAAAQLSSCSGASMTVADFTPACRNRFLINGGYRRAVTDGHRRAATYRRPSLDIDRRYIEPPISRRTLPNLHKNSYISYTALAALQSHSASLPPPCCKPAPAFCKWKFCPLRFNSETQRFGIGRIRA